MERIRFYRQLSVDSTFVVPAAPEVLLLDDINGTPTGAWSFRKLREAYAGNACRLRRDSDDSEQNFGFSGNNLDLASISTFSSGFTDPLFVVTMFDQSTAGNDITNSTPAEQPGFDQSFNSLPTMVFSGSVNVLTKVGYALGGTECAVYCAAEMGTATEGFGRLVSYSSPDNTTQDFNNANSCALILRDDSNNNVSGFYNLGQKSIKSISLDTPSIIASIWDGSNHIAYVANSAGTTVAATTAFGATGDMNVGSDQADTSWTGKLSELIIIPDESGDRTTIHDNQDAYWL